MRKKRPEIQYGQEDYIINIVVIAFCIFLLGGIVSLALIT